MTVLAINRRRLVTAAVGVLVVASVVSADMMPISPLESGYRGVTHLRARTDYRTAEPVSFAYGTVDLNSDSVRLLPEVGADACPACGPRHCRSWAKESGSLGLCLSALISLGLCSLGHRVKTLPFGLIPEWYHAGGPFQIGHRYAATPESLCGLQVCCLEPPDNPTEDSLLHYRRGTIHSLWRKAQFTPTALASRGPPSRLGTDPLPACAYSQILSDFGPVTVETREAHAFWRRVGRGVGQWRLCVMFDNAVNNSVRPLS